MEMFVDKVRITVVGGRGGDGAVAFHREKYVAAGGPDGGDGGHGGNVILRVNDNMSTLLDFRYKRKYSAQAGVAGQGSNRHGKRGENLIIQVPRGTVVRDAASNAIIVDMSTGEDFVIAKGQCPFCHSYPPGSPFCQAGYSRPGAGHHYGTEAAGRCGSGRLP